jgi:hypothetical protein
MHKTHRNAKVCDHHAAGLHTSCLGALMLAWLHVPALLQLPSARHQTLLMPRHHPRLPRSPCPWCLQELMQKHQACMQQLLLLAAGLRAAADPLLLPRLLPLPPPCLLLPLSLRPSIYLAILFSAL